MVCASARALAQAHGHSRDALPAPATGKPFYLQAITTAARAEWIAALEHNIYLTANPRGGRFAAKGFGSVTSGLTIQPWAAPAADLQVSC